MVKSREQTCVYTGAGVDPVYSVPHEFRDKALQFVADHTSDAPLWRLHFGRVEGWYAAEPQLVLTCNTRPRMAKLEDGFRDIAGPCIAKGTWSEVWPVFEAHVRML